MALSKEERARDQNNFFFVEKLAKKAEKTVRRDTSMFGLTELSFTNITD